MQGHNLKLYLGGAIVLLVAALVWSVTSADAQINNPGPPGVNLTNAAAIMYMFGGL